MNRLRNALQRSIKTRFTTLTLQELKDFVLLQQFIYIASLKGISLNNLDINWKSLEIRNPTKS